jgi:hypothetical protein
VCSRILDGMSVVVGVPEVAPRSGIHQFAVAEEGLVGVEKPGNERTNEA